MQTLLSEPDGPNTSLRAVRRMWYDAVYTVLAMVVASDLVRRGVRAAVLPAQLPLVIAGVAGVALFGLVVGARIRRALWARAVRAGRAGLVFVAGAGREVTLATSTRRHFGKRFTIPGGARLAIEVTRFLPNSLTGSAPTTWRILSDAGVLRFKTRFVAPDEFLPEIQDRLAEIGFTSFVRASGSESAEDPAHSVD